MVRLYQKKQRRRQTAQGEPSRSHLEVPSFCLHKIRELGRITSTTPFALKP